MLARMVRTNYYLSVQPVTSTSLYSLVPIDIIF